MSAADRIHAILATLDADIAALTRLRFLIASSLDESPSPGNSSGPAPTLRLVPDPQPLPLVPLPEPRSQYMRPILAALASGPLTMGQIALLLGKSEGYWCGAFKSCPWFERANDLNHRPWLWRLSEAGRRALSASSAGTAAPAKSTGPGDCAGPVITFPA